MKYLCLLILAFLFSCGPPNSPLERTEDAAADNFFKETKYIVDSKVTLTDKKVKFLWREKEYDLGLKETFNNIVINKALIATLSAPERAALGFVVTFIGSDCNWDGDAREDLSNLKCKTLAALGLGYQCSDLHLGFLRQWFREDERSLKQLESCPIIPYTATRQNTFNFINLTVRGNNISVEFAANGINMSIGEHWSWTETDDFLFDQDNIKLIAKKESNIKQGQFGIETFQ